MPVESAADRAAFFNPAEFGTLAVYTTRAGSVARDIAGQLDRPHMEIGGGFGDVMTADRKPTFCCSESALPADAAGGDSGDTLAVAGLTFVVIEHQPDGTGLVLLTLGAA